LAWAGWRLRVPGSPQGGQYHGHLGWLGQDDGAGGIALAEGEYQPDYVYRSSAEMKPRPNASGHVNTFTIARARKTAGFAVAPGAYASLGWLGRLGQTTASGTARVVGGSSVVQWVSGAQFDPSWEGAPISIDNGVYRGTVTAVSGPTSLTATPPNAGPAGLVGTFNFVVTLPTAAVPVVPTQPGTVAPAPGAIPPPPDWNGVETTYLTGVDPTGLYIWNGQEWTSQQLPVVSPQAPVVAAQPTTIPPPPDWTPSMGYSYLTTGEDPSGAYTWNPNTGSWIASSLATITGATLAAGIPPPPDWDGVSTEYLSGLDPSGAYLWNPSLKTWTPLAGAVNTVAYQPPPISPQPSPTVATTAAAAPSAPSWFSGSTSILGMQISNVMLLGGAVVAYLLLERSGKL
jgi:hypothetical protein